MTPWLPASIASRPERLHFGSRVCILWMTAAAAWVAMPAHAQLSLTGAVELAVRGNPRVLVAQADVDKARAALSETKDVYVPSVNAGAAIGQAYGYSPNPPTLFTVNAQSLVFSAAQRHYIRAAHDGLQAANLTLEDVRETVAEDTAVTFIALDHDLQRDAAFRQESEYANRLVEIVQERFDAGVDSREDLINAKLAAAQLRSRILHAEDDTANDTAYLAKLTGIPASSLTIVSGFPDTPLPDSPSNNPDGSLSPVVAAAYANAAAKHQQAYGDTHFLYRPQFSLAVQYNRYATFTSAFSTLNTIDGGHLGSDEAAFGVQISIPLLDRFRVDKGREALADAAHALHEADNARLNVTNGQSRLLHVIAELTADTDIARLQQEQAEAQLETLRIRLRSAVGPGPLPTPKDEQNSRMAERDRYIDVLDRTFQLHQAEINLLRQIGLLEDWLHGTAPLPTPPRPSATSPKQP